MQLPFFPTRKRSWLGLLALLVLALACWLWWSAQRSERHLRQEPLACALPAAAANAPHPGMVWVPAGTLALGDTVYAEESPVRQVPVAGFWLDRTEVTNDEFAAFVKASAYLTVAERAVDAATHPELPPEMRKPGAVVFMSPTHLSGQGSPTLDSRSRASLSSTTSRRCFLRSVSIHNPPQQKVHGFLRRR